MKRLLFPLLLVWILGVSVRPARAQLGTGEIGQQARRGMEMAMMDLENQSLGITQEAMEESIGQEELQAFLDGAVVRLVLNPDGRFASSSMLGGELISFTVGKETFTTGEEWSLDENEWVQRSGEFKIPKKAQKVSLTVKAGDQEVTAKCFNRYKASDGPITFYLGPLDGYFCLGLVDEEG
jgi:hypothetical protein